MSMIEYRGKRAILKQFYRFGKTLMEYICIVMEEKCYGNKKD